MVDTDSRIRQIESLLSKALARDREAIRRRLVQFRRVGRGGLSDGVLDEMEARLEASAAAKARRQERLPPLVFPEALPITAQKDEIIAAIRRHPVVVVSGDTGSGKSTQIPKFCLAADRGIEGLIGHTQPRRIAAQAVARRIAEEMGQRIGQNVGYTIRFQDATPPEAYIKLMTDGILLAETARDRMLSAYDTIIVDEAHERSLNIDFILGYLRVLIRRRSDLRLVITSATIDTAKFSRAFGGAPIIEVSGRMYPVEVRYEPPAENGDESDLTPAEQAASAVHRILKERRSGDILVFMPTEQDIRETCELIAGFSPAGTLVLPLFARLSAAEQGRVFHPAAGRKIVVATNVAETSLTIPGIRFVVDTGLARIPRYSPRTRTTAMPIAPVSRSSADQRKGRCGRVAHGVCIRLYSEQDYLSRPAYTAPEILRANLAEVILRMLALGLGEVADFPFIDPPDSKSVADGFRLLIELGAIEEGGSRKAEGGNNVVLTDIGRRMARIPLDPRLGRMLIAARAEGCLEPISILAAALSIRDPRERPAEKAAEADRAHAAFNQPHSDFLTLLAIWNRFQQARRELKSVGQLKRFCRERFWSYRRMREWEDVFHQIMESAREVGSWKAEGGEKDKIHRCILSGFLSNIAQKKDKNMYRAAKGREVMIFPGSGLFNSAGDWIVAAELVETSRLFARTVASIDPAWLEPLGGRLCRSSFRDPRWDARRGEVVATEQVALFGLVIVSGRTVSYGRIDPSAAAEIFIREALVRARIEKSFSFLQHNLQLREKVVDLENRLRRRDLLVSEETQEDFYRQRLAQVCDTRSLSFLIKKKGGDAFLRMSEKDLMNYRPDEAELGLFPQQIAAAGQPLALRYRFEPGAESDGVTLQVPVALAAAVPPDTLEWLVPGFLREKIETLLKRLPKTLRMRLMPVNDTVETILREMPQGQGPFLTALGHFIHQRFGVAVPAAAWAAEDLPEHLKMRLSITAPDGRELAAGREPALLNLPLSRLRIPAEVRRRWERADITRWDFGDLPETITNPKSTGPSWTAFPALEPAAAGANLKLFDRLSQAQAVHPRGVAALCAAYFGKDFKFLKRSLAIPEELHPTARYFGGARRLEDALAERVVQDLFAVPIRTQKEFADLTASAGPQILPAGRTILHALMPVLQAYAVVRRELAAPAGCQGPLAAIFSALREELCHLLPSNFITLYDAERLAHIERYLRALAVRGRRALASPEKEIAKSKNVRIYSERLQRVVQTLTSQTSGEKRRQVEDLFWMIEEYKVSVFAPEIKTRTPVSPKRLEEKFGEIERMV
jgi:ATP-dependent helicase HrpA